MPRNIKLTHRELDIMSILWRVGSATVADVREKLADDIAYPTVLTMMRILEAKGYVRHELEGRAFRYYARVGANQAGDGVLRRLIAKVYQGSREVLITRLINDEDISLKELRSIRRLLTARIDEID